MNSGAMIVIENIVLITIFAIGMLYMIMHWL